MKKYAVIFDSYRDLSDQESENYRKDSEDMLSMVSRQLGYFPSSSNEEYFIIIITSNDQNTAILQNKIEGELISSKHMGFDYISDANSNSGVAMIYWQDIEVAQGWYEQCIDILSDFSCRVQMLKIEQTRVYSA